MVQFGIELIPAEPSQKRRLESLTHDYARSYADIRRAQSDGRLSMSTRAAMNTIVYIWDKIFRRRLIERYHLRFPVGLDAEDLYFVRCYAAVSESMCFIEEKFYRYLLVGGGISEITLGKNPKALGCLKSVDLIFSFFRENELWDRLCLIMGSMLHSLGFFKEHLPDDMQAEGAQFVCDIKRRWRVAIDESCPWDDRLQHLLGAMHGWASVRHEWRNGWRCPKKDRRSIFPGLREFSRPGLRKFFVCGVPVFTVVDVGGRRFFKLFGVKIRKKRIED